MFHHLAWACNCEESPVLTRAKRFADINTDTQVGGGRITENDPTYTLINIHGPTAGWTLGGVLILTVIAALLWFLHRRRQQKLKRVVARHRAAKWDAIGYHKNECQKIDHTRLCDCKPVHGHRNRRASNGGDIEDESGCRRSCIFDA